MIGPLRGLTQRRDQGSEVWRKENGWASCLRLGLGPLNCPLFPAASIAKLSMEETEVGIWDQEDGKLRWVELR